MSALQIGRQLGFRARCLTTTQYQLSSLLLSGSGSVPPQTSCSVVTFEPKCLLVSQTKLLHTSFLRCNDSSTKTEAGKPDPKGEAGEEQDQQQVESAAEKELKAQVEELNKSLDEWKAKHNDIMDKYRRSIAESDNMRKRFTKQVDEAKVFGIQGFSKDLLDVADVLEKAVQMGSEGQTVDDMHKGLEMTLAQLNQVFKRHGLEQVNPMNEKFDPNFHEALFQIPAPDKEPNTVLDVQKVGYTLKGRTVRPALVGVSKK